MKTSTSQPGPSPRDGRPGQPQRQVAAKALVKDTPIISRASAHRPSRRNIFHRQKFRKPADILLQAARAFSIGWTSLAVRALMLRGNSKLLSREPHPRRRFGSTLITSLWVLPMELLHRAKRFRPKLLRRRRQTMADRLRRPSKLLFSSVFFPHMSLPVTSKYPSRLHRVAFRPPDISRARF